MSGRPLLVLALAVTATSAAGADFAYTWPLELHGDDGAYRVELVEDVYRHAWRNDLRDLVVLDADGAEVAFGPLPPPRGAPADPVHATQPLPMFRLPRDEAAPIEESVEMHLVRGADGRLAPLVRSSSIAVATAAEHLILDASAISGEIDAIELVVEPVVVGRLGASVDVLASDDLTRWWPVADAQAIVSLSHEGRTLERRRIELPPLGARYLLLQRVDAPTPLQVTAATAHVTEYPAGMPQPPRHELSPPAQNGSVAPGIFEYDTAGAFPVERVQLALAQPNSVVNVRIESRSASDAPWTLRSQATAFRIRTGGTEISNEGDMIERTRDRQWRVVTAPPVGVPPRLVLEYRADAFVLLAQGRAPYRLAAGSHAKTRADYPLDALLDALNERLGESWTPARATTGVGSAVAGVDHRLPAPPLRWMRWGLWIVLAGGAAAIIGMVFRLLRERRSAGE